MLCWLYDEDRWPSGAAGGYVTKNHRHRQKAFHLEPTDPRGGEYFANDFNEYLKLTENESFLDIGAYRGDTVEQFLSFTNGKYSNILAVEPDEKSFKKLGIVPQTGKVQMKYLGCGAYGYAFNISFLDESGKKLFYDKTLKLYKKDVMDQKLQIFRSIVELNDESTSNVEFIDSHNTVY